MKVNYEVAKQYDARIVSTLPDYDEAAVRKHFATRFPNLSTGCDQLLESPRNGRCVPAVARDLPNQVYPGEVIFETGMSKLPPRYSRSSTRVATRRMRCVQSASPSISSTSRT